MKIQLKDCKSLELRVVIFFLFSPQGVLNGSLIQVGHLNQTLAPQIEVQSQV